MKEILIIGGSAGGATLAAELRRLSEDINITIIEKGPDISYGNCSLPYYFSGEIEEIDNLIVNTPEDFKKKYNVDAFVNEEVVSIDTDKKSVNIKRLESGDLYTRPYDILVLTTGAKPILPEDMISDNSFCFREVEDVRKIDKFIKENQVENITIVGNGYIGVELAEALTKGGFKVKLVGSKDQVLPIFDEDMAQIIHREMLENGVDLILGSRGQSIEGNTLTLENGETIDSDMFIVSIGVKPQNTLAQEIGAEIGETGGIVVDENYQTTIDSIYALGDVIELEHKLTKDKTMLQLAFPAHRQATIMANHLFGNKYRDSGVIGSSILRCFDLTAGSTGLNSKELEEQNIDYETIYMQSAARVHGSERISLKIIFAKEDGKLLGAQVIGEEGSDKRLDMLAALIFMGADVEDLWNNERTYMPEYSTTKDITNLAGNTAKELLEGSYEKVEVDQVRGLVEEGAFILDTNSSKKFERGHLKGSVNIPTDQLRSRLDELPKDQTIYTMSSNAYKILKNNDFDVINIEPSLGDIETYEYYTNILQDREPIVIK